jgi:ABC-type transport system substrate-binding protein
VAPGGGYCIRVLFRCRLALNEVLRTNSRMTGGLNYGRWTNAAFDALVAEAAEAADEESRRRFGILRF